MKCSWLPALSFSSDPRHLSIKSCGVMALAGKVPDLACPSIMGLSLSKTWLSPSLVLSITVLSDLARDR